MTLSKRYSQESCRCARGPAAGMLPTSSATTGTPLADGNTIRRCSDTGGQFSDGAVGGQQQAGNRSSILQRGAGHLGRIDHAHFHQVTIALGLGIETKAALALDHLVDHHRSLGTGVGADGTQRLFQRTTDDLDASFFFLNSIL